MLYTFYIIYYIGWSEFNIFVTYIWIQTYKSNFISFYKTQISYSELTQRKNAGLRNIYVSDFPSSNFLSKNKE
jgi:hypothetical protein